MQHRQTPQNTRNGDFFDGEIITPDPKKPDTNQ
jgi:hypothetical protein